MIKPGNTIPSRVWNSLVTDSKNTETDAVLSEEFKKLIFTMTNDFKQDTNS